MIRRRTLSGALFTALLVVGMARVVRAQAPARSPADSGRAWIVRVARATGAQACPCRSPSLLVPHDRELDIVGVGMRKVLHSGGPDAAEVDYDFQLLPLIFSRGTADENLRVGLCNGTRYCASIRAPSPWTTRAIGAGVLPLGFTALAPIAPRLRFQLRGAAGAIRLSKPVPVLEGHKFNFLAEASTSLELRVNGELAVTAGFVFNHISNGNTAAVNPGMNSRMFEIGFVRR